jgi:hypothetical protein
VLSVILCDQLSENLTAAVPCIQPVDACGGDEYDLIDAGPALVFLHGPWGLAWDSFLDDLARSFTVYALRRPQ